MRRLCDAASCRGASPSVPVVLDRKLTVSAETTGAEREARMAGYGNPGRARVRTIIGTSALALALGSAPALAQDAPGDQNQAAADDDVILVTAQFREQNVQDTP